MSAQSEPDVSATAKHNVLQRMTASEQRDLARAKFRLSGGYHFFAVALVAAVGLGVAIGSSLNSKELQAAVTAFGLLSAIVLPVWYYVSYRRNYSHDTAILESYVHLVDSEIDRLRVSVRG